MTNGLSMNSAVADRRSLEAEQEYLLRSLDDLDAELAAGDLSQSAYDELRTVYTARVAGITRRLAGLADLPHGKPSGAGRRRLLWIGGVLGFGVLAGLLLAFSAGERGVGDQLTGSIEETPRQRVFRCQQLGQDPSSLLESFECFDAVLARDPENAEALTYRGWYGVLASGSAQQAGETDLAAELLASARLFLDRAIEADPTYPDARAFRLVVLERLGRTDAACADAAALAELAPPEIIVELTAPVIARLGCREP